MPRYFGKRIMLREYRREDAGEMYRWVNDPEITDTLNDSLFFYPQGIEYVDSFITDHIMNRSCSFVIADLKDEGYLGQTELFHMDYRNGVAELGITLAHPALMGKGIGQEAVKLMLSIAFAKMNLHRVELNVYDFNQRAIHCYEKCGFRHEGTLRKKHFKNGDYADILMMGILKEDYLADRSELPINKSAAGN